MLNVLDLETERLLLRKIEVEDAPFFYKLFNSEGWLKYIGDRNIHTLADAEAQLTQKYIPSYTANGYGSYVVVEKSSGNAIGTCGIYKRDNLRHPDIGFAFLPAYEGKGYGFEAAAKVLTNARDVLGVVKVLAFTVTNNKASIRLLEKLGLTSKGNYFFEGNPEPLLLFEINLLV